MLYTRTIKHNPKRCKGKSSSLTTNNGQHTKSKRSKAESQGDWVGPSDPWQRDHASPAPASTLQGTPALCPYRRGAALSTAPSPWACDRPGLGPRANFPGWR